MLAALKEVRLKKRKIDVWGGNKKLLNFKYDPNRSSSFRDLDGGATPEIQTDITPQKVFVRN